MPRGDRLVSLTAAGSAAILPCLIGDPTGSDRIASGISHPSFGRHRVCGSKGMPEASQRLAGGRARNERHHRTRIEKCRASRQGCQMAEDRRDGKAPWARWHPCRDALIAGGGTGGVASLDHRLVAWMPTASGCSRLRSIDGTSSSLRCLRHLEAHDCRSIDGTG